MANQMIALQARGPQLPDMGVVNARYANMMGQMANMDKMRLERDATIGIRNVMSDPSFNPTDPASINKLLSFGPAGSAAAQQLMQAQKMGSDMMTTRQAQAEKRVGTVGAGLVGMLRDPSDATLAQTIGTFKAVGMDPAEYEGVMAQLSQIPDANQRKVFLLNFISRSDTGRAALKFVLPDIKFETVGDAHIAIDNNSASPTAGQEIFRITASPEPTKLKQQVVDNTLYNVNDLTGVAQEATIGDAMAGMVPAQRTATRTDTGVVSPYVVGGGASTPAPSMGNAPAMTPNAGGGIPGPRIGGGSVATALQTNPGALKDGAFARSQPGYKGGSGGFAMFETPQQGVAAQEKLLQSRYLGRGLNTVDKIVNTYAPQGPENSADGVRNYKLYVAQRAGVNVNQPLSAQNIPAVAAAMREFETGQRPGGKAGATPRGPSTNVGAGAPSQTIAEAQKEKAFKLVMPIIGYNPKTGDDAVTQLISGSTSGGAQMLGSNVMGYFGVATEGRKALGQLRAIADNMTFEKLRGKLGAQISDADVKLIEKTMGDIANGNTPAEERLAVWQNVVLPILQRGANMPPKAAIDRLRKQPSLRGEFDAKYGKGKAAAILGR